MPRSMPGADEIGPRIGSRRRDKKKPGGPSPPGFDASDRLKENSVGRCWLRQLFAALFDAVATLVEALGLAITAGIQTLIDAITALVETLINPVRAISQTVGPLGIAIV